MKDVAAIAVVILAAFVINAAKGHLDRKRIREYVEDGGSEVFDIVWKRFGKGWFGSGNQRIYDVTYRNRDGQILTATQNSHVCWSLLDGRRASSNFIGNLATYRLIRIRPTCL